MNLVNLIIIVAEVAIVIFELRSLLQSSGADYYGAISQTVAKVTEPLLKLLPIKNRHLKGFFYAGFVVALGISLVAWAIIFTITTLQFDILVFILMSVLMVVKSFGYLLIVLLFAQALTSWLPSTRGISMELYKISNPIVAPVQKLIPPIGMIDISLMVIIIALYFLNSLCYKLLGVMWAII